MYCETILKAIGHTPIIKLQKTAAHLKSNIYVKLEFLNIGGSHKARIAFAMIKAEEDNGKLKPNTGQTIVAPTGGNTGIGLAIAGSLLGYKVILVIPDNYSPEKQRILKTLGAEIVLSDSKLGNNSHGIKATEICLENPAYVLLDQASHPANPEIHRKTTAIEIIDDLKGKVINYFVGGIGTGGSITGIGEILKNKYFGLKIVGVQPEGCDLLKNIFVPHKIQGLAVGIIPRNLNINIIDEMISVSELDAIKMMNHLAVSEGLCVGISSAANIVACIKKAEQCEEKINLLTLAYDSGAQYLEYF